MFISRLVKGQDIRIFGRAIALKHQKGRDDATQSDIELRPWKSRWPHYIRIHNAEFVSGTMENGVSLSELMDALGSNSFATTQRHAARANGNIKPRRSLMQQPAVRLSNDGFEWLSARLQNAFDVHGRVPHQVLRELDFPGTTEPGYRNRNDQTVIRKTSLPGNDHNQRVYVLECSRCQHRYGANGSDIWQRRCPQCGGGRPGLSIEGA